MIRDNDRHPNGFRVFYLFKCRYAVIAGDYSVNTVRLRSIYKPVLYSISIMYAVRDIIIHDLTLFRPGTMDLCPNLPESEQKDIIRCHSIHIVIRYDTDPAAIL